MTVPPSPSKGRPSDAIEDRPLSGVNGFLMLAVGLALAVYAASLVAAQVGRGTPLGVAPAVLAGLAAFFIFKGLVVLPPNTSLVCLLFGRYAGTLKRAGFTWVNPFY